MIYLTMETTRRWPYFHSLQIIINTLAEVRSLPSPQNVPPPVAVPPIREKCSSESTCMGQTLYKLKIASNFSHFFYIISKRLLTATLQICKNFIYRYRPIFTFYLQLNWRIKLELWIRIRIQNRKNARKREVTVIFYFLFNWTSYMILYFCSILFVFFNSRKLFIR